MLFGAFMRGNRVAGLDCVVDFVIPYSYLSCKFEVCRIIELSSMKGFINSLTSKFISQRCQKGKLIYIAAYAHNTLTYFYHYDKPI